MRLYEGMFLVDNSEARKDYDSVHENITRIISKYGGEVMRTERWAERKLAYAVRRRDRGTYVLVYFNASPESITEIRRDCAIDEVILRSMILRASALPEEAPESKHEAEPAAAAGPAAQEEAPQPDETAEDGAEEETETRTEEPGEDSAALLEDAPVDAGEVTEDSTEE